MMLTIHSMNLRATPPLVGPGEKIAGSRLRPCLTVLPWLPLAARWHWCSLTHARTDARHRSTLRNLSLSIEGMKWD
jgi:hypothetical protein